MPRASRVICCFALGAVALTACVRQQPPGMSVRRLPAELVFGVPELEEAAAPAGLTSPDEEPEPFVPDLRRPPPFNPTTMVPCRQAGPNDVPAEEANVVVAGRPKEGVFSWKQKGQDQPPNYPFRFPLPDFVERQVKDVRPEAGSSNFSFKTVEREQRITSRTLVTSTFRVDLTNASANLRGIFLTQIINDRRDGSAPRVFNPTPPITFLPMPVNTGNEGAFQTIAVDTATLETMSHSGVVRDRLRVDACGTLIDSWLVDGEQTFGGIRRDYNYAIATQFGGVIIFEHSESPCPQTVDGKCQPPGTLVYDTNIARTEPESGRKEIQ